MYLGTVPPAVDTRGALRQLRLQDGSSRFEYGLCRQKYRCQRPRKQRGRVVTVHGGRKLAADGDDAASMEKTVAAVSHRLERY